MTLSFKAPAYPFSGFRGTVYTLIAAQPGRFHPVPAAVGRGFNATTAAKKINLRLQRDGQPFEVRTQGPAKAPTAVGLFVVGAIGEGRVSRDSRSGQRRTAANEGAENFGKERISPTLVRYAEKREGIEASRAAAIETAKKEVLATVLTEAFGEPALEAPKGRARGK